MSGPMMQPPTRPRPKSPSFLRDPLVLSIVACIAIGFGGFLYWAATAQLAQGITASGVLALQDQRRSIQHLEGGIISDITIREGQSVQAGDLLVTLTDANAAARLRQVEADMAARAAGLDRLEANLSGATDLAFTRLDALDFTSFESAALRAAETQVFLDQAAALNGRRRLVEAKIARLEAEQAALSARAEGKERELVTLQEELEVQDRARQQQIGNISRFNEVRRQVAVTEAALITLDREKAVLDSSMAEAAQELQQVDLTFRAEAAQLITRLRAELSTLTAQREALLDRQTRRQLFAPIDGVIIDLAFASVGGVVRPGETLFDIVPKEEVWRVDVRFDPKDRDDLAAGLDVNLRFGTLDPINPPEVPARVDVIAADTTFEEPTQIYYYSAEVGISDQALEMLSDFTLSPGIPVEVFLDSGVTRTPISYFFEPIEVMLRMGLRG